MTIKKVDVNNPVAPKEKMTFEEFLEWSDEDVMAELVDGRVIIINGAEAMAVKESDMTEQVAPREKMTFEEFLTWSSEHTMAEWIDGEAHVMSPAPKQHQRIGSFLEKTLGLFVEVRELGEVFRAPFVMRTQESMPGREPDLLFVSRERAHLIEKTYLNGAADLVVEIVSPESIGRDRGDKFVEYERAGVREYWLLDYERESPEFYELGSDGRYRLDQLGPDGVYESKVISGFRLRLGWLWQDPPPTLEALRELKLIP